MTGMSLQDAHCKVTGRGDTLNIHYSIKVVNV